LPLYRRTGDIDLSSSEDVGADWIRAVSGPSEPRAGLSEGRRQWDIVSHLSLNHLSLLDGGDGEAVEAFRQMLRLYAPRTSAAPASRMIKNLRAVTAETAVARLHPQKSGASSAPQPIVFGRGIDLGITFEEDEVSAAMLAAVLERFMAGYAPGGSADHSLNVIDEVADKQTTPMRGSFLLPCVHCSRRVGIGQRWGDLRGSNRTSYALNKSPHYHSNQRN